MARFISTIATFREAVARAAGARELAVDTEFHTERRYRPELMLVQLRVDAEEPLLIDPRAGLPLAELGPLLGTAPVVVHGGQSDAVLLRDATGVAPNVVFDTQVAAGCAGEPYPARLQDLVSRYLGVQLDKAWTLSDWGRRPLAPEQLEYAAEDVLVLGALRLRLTERLDALGTLEIAEQATREIVARALADDDDALAWRAVNGAHILDGREAAALQQLAAWRQAEARARDVPRHSVLSDGMLLDLSRRRPDGLDALRANRRLPSSVVKREGAALLDAVARAAGTRIDPLQPWPKAWADLVRAAGRVSEARSGVAVDLLLPDRVLKKLYEGETPGDWRDAVLGKDFFEFLAGRGSMRMPSRSDDVTTF